MAASCAAGVALISVHPGAAAQQGTAVAVAAKAVPCGGPEIARGVGSVLDGGDFQLSDGRIVHLAGIEVPLPAGGSAFAAPGGEAAKAALERLMSGAQVVVRQAESKFDRYGRVVAYAETVRGADRRSVEADLTASGFARVASDVGSRGCMAVLLRAETAARKAKIGLWANPYYDPLRAAAPDGIVAERGRFALVEGNVVTVHESGAILYLNFGPRWSRDFAVKIRKRNERRFAAAGLNLKALAGKPVEVRGWIETRAATGGGGAYWHAPWIEAAFPAQVQLAHHE